MITHKETLLKVLASSSPSNQFSFEGKAGEKEADLFPANKSVSFHLSFNFIPF